MKSGEFKLLGFPYGILYIEEPEEIFILAIMHLHRYPDYWKERKGISS